MAAAGAICCAILTNWKTHAWRGHACIGWLHPGAPSGCGGWLNADKHSLAWGDEHAVTSQMAAGGNPTVRTLSAPRAELQAVRVQQHAICQELSHGAKGAGACPARPESGSRRERYGVRTPENQLLGTWAGLSPIRFLVGDLLRDDRP